MTTKVVKMCDMPITIAVKVFAMLNPGKVKIARKHYNTWWEDFYCITDTQPDKLVYPEGWYFSKEGFCNKNKSSNGRYEVAPMVNSSLKHWIYENGEYHTR